MKDNIIIFSGAGLSAESGISTFRDSNGLWEKYDIKKICSAGCLNWNYNETIHFYNLRRDDIKDKKPNYAHKKIAEIKNRYPDRIDIITQNVDDLLERADCKEVLHLHGYLKEIRCMRCNNIENIGYQKQEKLLLKCKKCGYKMRPNVVFFGEPAPKYEELYNKLENCSLFIVIGTSGNVIDVSYLSQTIKFSILNNLYKSDAIIERVFTKVYYKKVTKAIDDICNNIENYIENSEI